MLVGMYQLPWPHVAAEHLDLAVPAYRPGVGVADTKPCRKRLEAEGGHFVDIADTAVRQDSDATKRPVKRGVNFADVGADNVRTVQILDYKDLRSGHTCDVL